MLSANKTTDQTLAPGETTLGMSNTEGEFWCVHFLEVSSKQGEIEPDGAMACTGCDTCGTHCGT
jgi:hypothetical protein